MPNSVVSILSIIGAPALISGLALWWFSRRMNALDRRGEMRKRETVLILRGLLTIGGLASATARAVKDGQVNGGVSEALEAYSEYREDLSAFLVEQTARKSR
jgi:hypothetical protein